MDETLKQVGELLLGSIPTIFFFLLLYGLYTLLVHKPMARVLGERDARTRGAIEKARADVAAAEARTAQYERRLKEARFDLFKRLEARRAQAAEAREAAIAEAKSRAQVRIAEARAGIEQEKRAAKENLAGEAERLAAEIIRTLVGPALAESSSR